MNKTQYHTVTEKKAPPETVAALLTQFSIQANGRGRGMNNEYEGLTGERIENPSLQNRLNDYDDITEKVICKLTALTDLFQFFEYANGKTDFRKKTIPGLFYLIDDCIDDLEEVKI